MANDVEIRTNAAGSYMVLEVHGYLDVATSPELRHALTDVAAQLAPVVLVDLTEVSFVDSSGLGVILHGWKLLQGQDGTLAVISPQERVTKLFEITGLTISVPLYPTLDEAKAALGLTG